MVDQAASPREPRTVAVADIVTGLAIVLAAGVAIGGGFRFWLGDVRVSVTSPARLLAAALVVAGVRHWLHPRPSLLSRALSATTRLTSSVHWRAVWPAFAVTRATVLVVGLLAVLTIGYPTPEPPFRVSTNEAINLPARWDAGWYIGIASTGYQWHRSSATRQQNIAFFPAFPLLTRVAGRILGGSQHAFLLSGLLISHLAFLWSLIYFHRLAQLDLGSAKRATWAVYLLATFPFAVFHGAVYTESLFLLGCVGAIVEIRRERLERAAAWGLLVGLTRPNGFLLAATLAVLVARPLIKEGVWSRKGLLRLAVVGAPVMGLMAYSGYVWWLTGDPFQWSAQHAAWGRTFTGIDPFVGAATAVSRDGLGAYVSSAPYDVLNAVAVVTTLALVVPIWRYFGLAYAVFVCANLIPPLFKGGVMSMGRLCATLFPVFLILALKLSSRAAFGLTLVCLALQALLAVLFYTWRPLF